MTSGDDLTCPQSGITDPGRRDWSPDAPWGRASTSTHVLGRGDDLWERASEDLLRWAVKTRSGFALTPDTPLPPEPGADLTVLAHLGPLTLREPVRVIDVVREADRVALSYATRRGHPIAGEEAFVLHRDGGGTVTLELRAVTAPAPGRWAAVFPLALLLQRVYRRRYARALR